MKENVEEIAKMIYRHRELEIMTPGINNKAVARSKVIYNGEESQFWLVNKENRGGVIYTEDITGAVIGTQVGNRTTIIEDGRPIYYNTRLGEILIKNHEGKHSNTTPTGDNIEFEIFSRATYKPSDDEYATELLVQVAGVGKGVTFGTLMDILNRTKAYQKEIYELKIQRETASEEEAKRLIERITEKELEKKAYLEKAQKFIRKHAELRHQPILDPYQEEIKRSNIFDGTLIIDGGPGTGKTTSLIQRLKFLIDIATKEVGRDYLPSLTTSQKEKLLDNKSNWIFFSPSELLALYLRNNMIVEGLLANNQKVKVWSNHKRELIKSYRLVNNETKRPFLFYNINSETPLFDMKEKGLKSVLSNFDAFYLNYQYDKLKKLNEIDVSFFNWNELGLSIQNYITKERGDYGFDHLIRLFINLNETYTKEVRSISDKYLELIKLLASRIQVSIKDDDNNRYQTLEKLLKEWKNDAHFVEEDVESEEEIDQEEFDETNTSSSFDFEQALFSKIKSLARKKSLKKYDKNTKFTKRDKELLNIITELNEQTQYDQLGQLAFFKKYFERVSKGLITNVFREIPMMYKRYRRKQLNSNGKGWNINVLEELVKKDANKRIHVDEQALLIYFINRLVKRVLKSFKTKYEELNHPFVNGYNNNSIPIIGVDEATDFRLIDLLTIHSMGDTEISSITYCGDVMQRMTKTGLLSWRDLTQSLSKTEKTEIRSLKISYRQSSTLLALAKEIYKKSTGSEANYEAYIEKYDIEPQPLMLISNDNEEKLKWISNRIHEIYVAYGDSIPSIAIFLPKEDQLEKFAKSLAEMDTLADVGIEVKACRNGEVLGDKNTIRIFSINVIKGLEFEAVFFHDMDELLSQNLDDDLLLKYLYVGLSRATFYMGLTLKREFNDDLSFLNEMFNTDDDWRIGE